VEFVVQPDGSISRIRLNTSSGLSIFDQAAIKAVEKATPLTKLPAGSNEPIVVLCRFGGGRNSNNPLRVCLHPKKVIRLNEEGDRALSEHRYSDAVSIYYDQLGRLEGIDCIDLRKLLASFDGYVDSLKNDPNAARLQLYRELSVDSSYTPARESLNAIIMNMGSNPASFEDRLALARHAKTSGDIEVAIGEYQEALRLQYNDQAHSELFDLQRRIRLEKDIEQWDEFLKAHPDSVQGRLGRGETLQRLNRFDDAEKEYRQALSIDPTCEAARQLLQQLRAPTNGDGSQR
jgi:TonB family protein